MGHVAQSITTPVQTWATTQTGFSVDMVLAANDFVYYETGSLCTVEQRFSTAGTSNAASLTLTFPFAHANTANHQYPCVITDNGTRQGGIAIFTANSNIVTLAKVGGAAITGSGTKSCAISITYPKA